IVLPATATGTTRALARRRGPGYIAAAPAAPPPPPVTNITSFMTSAGEPRKWQFWIDRGGTFTDVVALSPDGVVLTHKLLSDNPRRYRDAAIAGIRDLLGVAPEEPVPHELIDSVKMGTTVATNALLEGRGEPTVLVTTRGFGD